MDSFNYIYVIDDLRILKFLEDDSQVDKDKATLNDVVQWLTNLDTMDALEKLIAAGVDFRRVRGLVILAFQHIDLA